MTRHMAQTTVFGISAEQLCDCPVSSPLDAELAPLLQTAIQFIITHPDEIVGIQYAISQRETLVITLTVEVSEE